MQTNSLIAALAADNQNRAKPTSWILAAALVCALPLSSAIFMMKLGVRPDVMAAMHNPFFNLKFAVMIPLAIVAAVLALKLARPGVSARRVAWWLAIPAGLLGIGVATDLMLPQPSTWSSRMMGSNSMLCLTAIPLLAAPLLVASLIGLRHGAVTRPAVAGAAAGLLSGGIAATLYAAHCFDDSPLFVAVWYSIAIGVVAAVGALVGTRVLRF